MLRIGHLSMGCAPLPHLYLLSGKPKYSNLNKLLIDPEGTKRKFQVQQSKSGAKTHISTELSDIEPDSEKDTSSQVDGNCLSLIKWEVGFARVLFSFSFGDFLN